MSNLFVITKSIPYSVFGSGTEEDDVLWDIGTRRLHHASFVDLYIHLYICNSDYLYVCLSDLLLESLRGF